MLPLHPAIVHVPLGLALAVPAVLLALTVALFRRKATPRAFWVAALMQALVLGGGLLALATGEHEEARVEAVVSEAALERHEDLATLFVVAAGVTLVLTLGATLARDRWSRVLAVASTAASAGALALGIAVGHAGGTLVYRDGAASAAAARAAGPRDTAGGAAPMANGDGD